jgi:hypothetical protein
MYWSEIQMEIEHLENRQGWEDNIKMNLKAVGSEGVDWAHSF